MSKKQEKLNLNEKKKKKNKIQNLIFLQNYGQGEKQPHRKKWLRPTGTNIFSLAQKASSQNLPICVGKLTMTFVDNVEKNISKCSWKSVRSLT